MANAPSFAIPKKIQWIGTVGAWALSVWICTTPIGQSLERMAYDLFFHIRGARSPDPGIVVVAIDEPSFGVLAHQWPWPRSWHARLLDRLFDDGAAAVALDLVFAEPSDPEEDRAMADALSKNRAIILAVQIENAKGNGFIRQIRVGPPADWWKPGVCPGRIDLPVDPDGFIRRMDLTPHDGLMPLAFSAAKAWHPQTTFPEGNPFPSQPQQSLLINYAGPAGTTQTLSYYQALLPGHLPKGLFKDKLVFVGFQTQSDTELVKGRPDHFPVPYTRWGHGVMAGVEIHAQTASSIHRGNLIRPIEWDWVFAANLLSWAIASVLFFQFSPGAGTGVWGVLSIFACGIAYFMFSRWYRFWPVTAFFIPLTALYGGRLVFFYTAVLREKRFIRQAFSTYVAPAVVNRLVRERDALNLGGEQVEITAFFSDIQGFTTISESLSPQSLVALLNDYLTEMTDIILNNGGTVDKFEGDAIVAFFGAPTAMVDHAESACRTALQMQTRLGILREKWIKEGKPAIHMRIGLNSGQAVVGNMGSRNRMDYTMMGDTPNTASRLEGANKVYGTTILVGASTARQAGNGIIFREIDTVLLKGKGIPLTIFEPRGVAENLITTENQLIKWYLEGLTAYRRGDWRAAVTLFDQALCVDPKDGPSKVLKSRCVSYERVPPVPWQSVFVLEGK